MILYQNLNVLGDNIGYIKLIGVMGSDLEIVNDARVSYQKYKDNLDEKDEKLIKYLILHQHTSPMRGSCLKFEVKAPLYITRQIYKHHVSSNFTDAQDGWNEKSLRYVEGSEFYLPKDFRKASSTNKQVGDTLFDKEENEMLTIKYKNRVEMLFTTYKSLLESGVCREQARGVLPTAVYTSFRWTTSLDSVLNFIKLRDSPDAQWEIRQYAKNVKEAIKPSFPITLNFFTNTK